jgi:hypothetical protein
MWVDFISIEHLQVFIFLKLLSNIQPTPQTLFSNSLRATKSSTHTWSGYVVEDRLLQLRSEIVKQCIGYTVHTIQSCMSNGGTVPTGMEYSQVTMHPKFLLKNHTGWTLSVLSIYIMHHKILKLLSNIPQTLLTLWRPPSHLPTFEVGMLLKLGCLKIWNSEKMYRLYMWQSQCCQRLGFYPNIRIFEHQFCFISICKLGILGFLSLLLP